MQLLHCAAVYLLHENWRHTSAATPSKHLGQQGAIGSYMLRAIMHVIAQIHAVTGCLAIAPHPCGEKGLNTCNRRPVGLQPLLRKLQGISHLRSITCAKGARSRGTL